jgi:1,2-phenylacetyl-CoA epoxidase PaaB subunit
MVGDGGDFSFYFLVTGCSDEERALFIARDAFSRRVTLIDNMLAPARK